MPPACFLPPSAMENTWAAAALQSELLVSAPRFLVELLRQDAGRNPAVATALEQFRRFETKPNGKRLYHKKIVGAVEQVLHRRCGAEESSGVEGEW